MHIAEPPAYHLHAVAKFNPHLWDGGELRACFVARQRELEKLLSVVRETTPDSAPQHWLVVGLRGMGKSTLLQRLALAVSEAHDLHSEWYALIFPEEQYTVATLADFWCNCLDALADALQRQGVATAELNRLDARIADLETLPLAERESAALNLLLDSARQRKRRLLLLVDSMDLLFGSLAGGTDIKPDAKTVATRDGGAAALWRLRSVLSETPELLIIGAAYQALEATLSYSDAFHDFFAGMELRPLSVAEMCDVLLALARQFGAGLSNPPPEQAEVQMLSRIHAHPGRLEALRDLTGGNPRTTVMLYELFSAGGADNVRADLERLLDQVTPLYKARMEMLPDQQRQLIAHLMQAWAPQTARQLADLSHLPVTTVNGQLRRLELDGLVQKVNLPGKARSGYQTAERFFNIWYLMRNAPRRVRQRLVWIIEFLKLWYSSSELSDLARSRIHTHNDGKLWNEHGLEFSRALAAALPEGDERRYLDLTVLRGLCGNLAERNYFDLFDFAGEDQPLLSEKEYQERFAELDAKILINNYPELEQRALNLIKGIPWLLLIEKERWADKLATASEEQYAKMLVEFEKSINRRTATLDRDAYQEIYTKICRGEINLESTKKDLLSAQINQGLSSSRSMSMAWLYAGVVAQTNSAADFDEEFTYRKAIGIDPAFSRPWNDMGNLLADKLQRYEDAEAAYRKAIEIDPRFSWAWNNLGVLLGDKLQRYAEAEAAYRKAVEIDPKLVKAWNNLGLLLEKKLNGYEQADKAELAFRQGLKIENKHPFLLINLGSLLIKLGRNEEAAEYLRRVLEVINENASELTSKSVTAIALTACAHLALGNQDTAGLALNQLLERAANGDSDAFEQGKQITRECLFMGKTAELVSLLDASPWAAFAQPFAVALRAAAANDPGLMGDAPPEVRLAADKVYAMLRGEG